MMDSYPFKFKLPVNPEGGEYDFCIQRASERLSKPNSLPVELNGVLYFEQYQNIVNALSKQIEMGSKYRIIRLYTTTFLIFTILIPTLLVIYHLISLTVHIISMISIFVLLGLYNLIFHLKVESKFNSVLDDLNHCYSNNGIRLYKINKPYGNGNYRYTLKRIYILYSNQNYISTPQNPPIIPPPLYYIAPQPQYTHVPSDNINQNQNNNNNSLYPVILTTKIISNEHEHTPLIK